MYYFCYQNIVLWNRPLLIVSVSSDEFISFVLQMSYKAVEFAVEQSLSDLLFHVDSQERPVSLPEKTLVPPKRKWRVYVQPLFLFFLYGPGPDHFRRKKGTLNGIECFPNVSYRDYNTKVTLMFKYTPKLYILARRFASISSWLRSHWHFLRQRMKKTQNGYKVNIQCKQLLISGQTRSSYNWVIFRFTFVAKTCKAAIAVEQNCCEKCLWRCCFSFVFLFKLSTCRVSGQRLVIYELSVL